MFADAVQPPIDYCDPWLASYEDRLRALIARDRRVAYFYERPDTSTFRYRVFNMVQALDAAPERGVSASWFTLEDLSRGLEFIERADVLVICRSRYDAMVGRMIAQARARGLPVLFDVDDLIFDPDYVHLIVDTLDQPMACDGDWTSWFGWTSRLGATLRLCDGAITTNALLAERIRACAPWMSPRVVPNFLNRSQVAVSQAIYERKLAGGFRRDERIHIGYFSGTPTHSKDFRIAADALARLLARDRRLALRIVGFLEPKGPIARFSDRIDRHPLQDFVNLQRLQGEVEICIAPLQSNAFTNCKSELKYFEPAVTGTVTIASPTFTFLAAIADGENGFLAPAQGWEAKIGQVIGLLDDDPADYAAIAQRAFTLALEAYRWDHQAPAIEAALFRQDAPPPAAINTERDQPHIVGHGRAPAVT